MAPAAGRSTGVSCRGGWGCSVLLPPPECQGMPGARPLARGVCVCIIPTPAASFPLGEHRQSLLPELWYSRETLQVFPCLLFSSFYHGMVHRMPPKGLLPSPAAQVRLVAVSRVPELSQSCPRVVSECCSGQGAGILLFSLAVRDSSAPAITAWTD